MESQAFISLIDLTSVMSKSNKNLISVAEAIAKVSSGVKSVSNEHVALSDGLGRVLATDVKSRLTHPPVDVSAMDGYAVSEKDLLNIPVTLKQVGISAAGSGFKGKKSFRPRRWIAECDNPSNCFKDE